MSTQGKHLLNTADSLVLDSLQGLCALNPSLSLDRNNKVVYVTERDPSKVSIICGGGSGHEPAHSGFVGKGLLSAAVCGGIFASPSSDQVFNGIEHVQSKAGTVIIVKNYTGDVLNFGLAREKWESLYPNQSGKVKMVIVGDDVAIGRSQGKLVGRRGLAGTTLVYKMAGALAQNGGSLGDVYTLAEWVASRIGTIGVGLGHCHVPGTAIHEDHLAANEIEIGMGIHNEPGYHRLSPIPSISALVPRLIDTIVSTTDSERSFLPFKGDDEVFLLVNNLGGVSELELGALANEASRDLQKRGISVKRLLSGSYMTSLNMTGFSITLLLLPFKGEDSPYTTDQLISFLDEDSDVPGWKWSSRRSVSSTAPSNDTIQQDPSHKSASFAKVSISNPTHFVNNIKAACEALIAAEPEITKMDTVTGDGDCGLTLKAGAIGVLNDIKEGRITPDDPIGSIYTFARAAERDMGGTSGALYSIFFTSLTHSLNDLALGQTKGSSDVVQFSEDMLRQALQEALSKLYGYTRARPPSRTLVDPLAAFIETFGKGADLQTSVNAARSAAEETKNLEAKAGRSAYVGKEHLKEQAVPDPGAWGVKIILENLLSQ